MSPLQSRMPDDPGYWNALAGRIAADAAPVLDEYYARRGTWWATLAHRAPALAAAAVLVLTATSFLLAGTARTDGSPYVQTARAIGPTDPIAQLFLTDATPPRVESLLPVMGREGREP